MDPVAALTLVAHGGVAGAVVEAMLALLLVGLATAVWLGRSGDEDDDNDESEIGEAGP